MHASNLVDPWILLRLAAGVTAFALFLRGGLTALRVLRHFDVRHATEGQLALERQVELGATLVRVAAIVQVASLGLGVLAADRLSKSVRGAMCAFGVLNAEPLGLPALAATGVVALAAAVLAQLFALDARVRGLDLVRPLAVATLLVLPLAAAELAMTSRFLLGLDLTAVASCCSVTLDADEAGQTGYPSGPRVAATLVALIAVAVTVALGLFAARSPTRLRVVAAGLAALVALPAAGAAAMLEVAPHAFEVPQHVCPFCLLKPEVLGVGYPLFGAIFLAAAWGVGAGVAALVARGPAAREAFPAFARERLRRGAAAWIIALAVGAAPVLRYAIVTGGASLFP